MRIAILSPYPTFPFRKELGCRTPSYEGNATWTVALANHLAKIPDTEVHVVTEADGIPQSKTIVANGVQVHFITAPEKYKTLTLWHYDRERMMQALDQIQPDIVHGQGIENQYGFAAVTSKWPHLLTIHGIPRLSNEARYVNPFHRERIVELMALSSMKNARDIVVINPYVTKCLALEGRRYRLYPIANPVGHQFFDASPQAREPALILAIGSVDRLKAHDVLLRALAILRRRKVQAKAIIAGSSGESGYVGNLQRFVREENLDVQFAGFQTPGEILLLLQRCTMLVHPSRHENSPMAICEAMAVGTPVIASRVGGVPNLLGDGANGLLVQRGNASELADRIKYLLEDEPARNALGAAGRKYALETHHPDRVAQLTRAAYEEILKNETTKEV